MMGRKEFRPRLFHSLSLDEMVPKDHLLRRLEAVVDLSFVRGLCAPYYSHTGQPSIDPVVLFKMMLLGYLYGIISERRLAEECSLHLAFRWYLGYDLDEETPDHSVLSKARARYGKEVFEAFFQRVLGLCVEAGLVAGEKVFADSTLVAANASVKSLVPREQLFQPALSPSEHLERVFVENPADLLEVSDRAPAPASPGLSDERQPEPVDRSMPAQGTRASAKRGRKPKPRRCRNTFEVSRTDPDSSIITRPGLGTLLSYKEHFTVDSCHRVVTAVEVTPAAWEDSAQVSKLLEDQPIKPREFCADSHYGVPKVYAELKRRGILPVIPRRSPQTRRPKPGRLPASAFEYFPEGDLYLCPQGRELKRAAYDARWDRYHYRPRLKDCQSCPLRGACSTPKTVHTIIRYPDQEAMEWALAYLDSPAGQQTFSQRGVMAEWVIAEAKSFHGLRRALHRGLQKVKIQALLIASVQNLKRLLVAASNRLASLVARPGEKILNLQLRAA